MNDVRRTLTARPLLFPLVTAMAVIAMLLVPFSYQKTVAYDVSFHLTGGSPALAPALATAFQESFGATSVNTNSPGNGEVVLVARVPAEKAAGIATHARSYANVLATRGFAVTTDVQPVRETVSGNLFAMTRDQTIHVDITATGRTPAEIEADVRRQLEAAGITGADVTVSQDDGHTTIQVIHAHGDGTPDAGSESSSPDPLDGKNFEITVDGKTPDPSKTATVRIQQDGNNKLSDADLEKSIEDQLRAQGHPADVEVAGGKVLKVTPIKN